MNVLIEAGGSVHRLDENFATTLAENLRAYRAAESPETAIPAADKLEQALVERHDEPIVFTGSEGVQVAKVIDAMGRPDTPPEILAIYWALLGHVPGA
jgi:hypothetical protein